MCDKEDLVSFNEAYNSKNWIMVTMQCEYDAIMRNGTWSLRNLPPSKKAIGTKWVYKVKYHANGEVEKYKARLVAQGYS